MQIDPTLFREYDMRGVSTQTLTTDAARAIGKAYASEVKALKPDAKSIAVGYDGRLSSPALEAALVQGMISTGMDVVRIGLGPTPMLYVATVLLKADAGIMVTGSHNPPDHNGFKCLVAGKPFYGADIARVRTRIETENWLTATPGVVREEDVRVPYVDSLVAAYKAPRGLKVVWDAASGAAGEMLEALCKRLPGEHIMLNTEIDGTFPHHHADPTVPENLVQLIETVRAKGADLGIAFDGDGDRLGVVDGEGVIWWGDQIMQLYAEEILRAQPGATIIADVKASQALFDRVSALGGTPLMWKTGHSLIKAKMAEMGAPLAGEMSGHIFFADHYRFDDALYAAVRLVSLLANRKETLVQLRHTLSERINTPEMRIPVEEAKKFAMIENITQHLQAAKAQMSTVDGVRVQTKDGWWLLRASNTQAMVVARCESDSSAGLERLKSALTEALKREGVAA
jgi:phosphomannomutase